MITTQYTPTGYGLTSTPPKPDSKPRGLNMKASLATREKGASLLVGLILLLVATIVVFAGMRGTQMQERMTSNLNNKAISYMAAEAGASTFAEWVFAETAENGWPGEGSNHPTAGNVGGGEGRFKIPQAEVVWDDPPGRVSFVSIGESVNAGSVLAESRLRVEIEGPSGTNLPPTTSPYVCYGAACDVRIGGSAEVDGNNFALPAEYPCTGNGCESTTIVGPGVTGIYVPDNGAVCTKNGKDCDITDNKYVTGGITADGWDANGVNSNDRVADITNTPIDGAATAGDWSDFIASLRQPDVTFTSVSDVPSGSLNDRGDPKIYEIDGSVRLNSNTNMTGILVIRENSVFNVNGTWNFEGLILLEPGVTLNLGNGTANVYGSVISTGASTVDIDATLTGNVALRYSGPALGNVDDLFAGEEKILTWVEQVGS